MACSLTCVPQGALWLGPGARVPLSPGGARPPPQALSLRVLVDRSVVESFAQGGRATRASAVFSTGNATSLVYRPPAARRAGDTPPAAPVISVRVWAMGTGFVA